MAMAGGAGKRAVIGAALALVTLGGGEALAQSEALDNGFMHHGVATPVSNHRGIAATEDGNGAPVALVWLFDHRGGYALLMINALNGEAEQFAMPFTSADTPYASVLSRGNRFYTHFGNYFVEFDPVQRGFTFVRETVPQMAMSMTEDDEGVIWSATYPQSGVAAYNPATGAFRDYGHVYKQNWAQYPRSIAADDQGWIYFGLGNTADQIIILDRELGSATPVIPEAERAHGMAEVVPAMGGKVYGKSAGGQWYALYGGRAFKLREPPAFEPRSIITGSQGLFHRDLPNGERLDEVNLVDRRMTVRYPETGETRTLAFDYTSEGAHVMGLAAAPDGTIAGGTAFPMRFFNYDPRTDAWVNRVSYGQWNTVGASPDRFYAGGYGHGFLLEWDPSREWAETEQDNPASNPRYVADAFPDINRPHGLLVHPNGRHIIVAGTPGYGLTGGGLLFWDRQSGEHTVVPHTDILTWHSTMSLAALPGGKLLGGTTVAAGTGGEEKVETAELYLMDLESKAVEWHAPVLEGARSYLDLFAADDGRVFGVADRRRFFVFDSATRSIVHEQRLEDPLGQTISHQGPRIFVPAPDGRIFMLFVNGIAELDPATFGITLLAESPVPIAAGGDYLGGRIYFASTSHVYSWAVP